MYFTKVDVYSHQFYASAIKDNYLAIFVTHFDTYIKTISYLCDGI